MPYELNHARRPGRITTEEAARLLDRHGDTIRCWIHEGRLTDVERDRVGRYWISKTEVEELAARRDPATIF